MNIPSSVENLVQIAIDRQIDIFEELKFLQKLQFFDNSKYYELYPLMETAAEDVRVLQRLLNLPSRSICVKYLPSIEISCSETLQQVSAPLGLLLESQIKTVSQIIELARIYKVAGLETAVEKNLKNCMELSSFLRLHLQIMFGNNRNIYGSTQLES